MNSYSSIIGIFVLVICLGSSSTKFQLGWSETTVKLNENQGSVSAVFGNISGVWPPGVSFICTLSNSNDNNNKVLKYKDGNEWKPIKDFPKFILTENNQGAKIEFKAINDNICKDRRVSLIMSCTANNAPATVTFPKLGIKIKNTEVAGMCKDPHLTQKVNGIDEDGKQVTKKICYDLFGRGGEQMQLLSDNILGTSIVFELRDDYYIGKAFFSTKLGYFNFTTTTFSTPKLSSLNGRRWGREHEFVVGDIESYPHAIVKQHKQDILIEYNEEKRSQSIRIAKIQQGIGKNYLNVLVDKSTTVNGVFDENHGGIFGFIANQEYKFYDPVQLSSESNKGDLCVVKINGRLVKAFLTGERSETDRCYSMSLDDLLYPKNVYSFQKSL